MLCRPAVATTDRQCLPSQPHNQSFDLCPCAGYMQNAPALNSTALLPHLLALPVQTGNFHSVQVLGQTINAYVKANLVG